MKQHLTNNLWLWAGLMAGLAAVAAMARARIGLGYHLGDLAALALMASATFVIMISQRHGPQPGAEEDGP
ncbi:hypothetical protein [Paracraurococcus lichenis]|uniref:Uncharacterized protein n=1 Tax=Paracraurococcus lichenis TaxID=3064888 RepID=A0ABT9DXR2_9PROT|nr:hypothetical protein [Paracraurococcus sp. LOR1-02]MDO9708679.1 hypothetical protein [Paracraurococcus sp. LOR1-02]